MSVYDYRASAHLAELDAPFAAYVMAAYRKADTGNGALLEQAFPEITTEIRRRYNAPGGFLPGEQVTS